MLKNFWKTLFGKKTSAENTRKVEDTCNYWADENEVDYSPSFTAQDVTSSLSQQSVCTNKGSSETQKQHTPHTSSRYLSGGGGCGGGCIGGCGGGCL